MLEVILIVLILLALIGGPSLGPRWRVPGIGLGVVLAIILIIVLVQG